jgi:hypothetical protein
MLSEDEKIRELKYTAKWSLKFEEKKRAIDELTYFAGKAIPALTEIYNVTVYDEVKQACIEAIKKIKEKERQGKSS